MNKLYLSHGYTLLCLLCVISYISMNTFHCHVTQTQFCVTGDFLVCMLRHEVLLKRPALITVIRLAIIHQAVIEMTRHLSDSNEDRTVPGLIHSTIK